MSDLEENNSYYDITDDEQLSDNEILRLNKYDEIKDLKLKDFLEFPITNNLLNQKWEDDFTTFLEDKLVDIFYKYKCLLTDRQYNVLYKLNGSHLHLFISLIKHHLNRDYNLSMFENNPWLAQELIDYKNKIV